MAYLAKLAHADAIAVVLQMKGAGYVTYVAHNLPADTRWSDGMAAPLLGKAFGERTSDQSATGVAIPLADGRTADTLAVVPVVWKEQLVGALAALGSGRVFAPDELSSLTRVAELLGLELAEANALWRAQRQQQEAETKLKATRDLQAIIRRERDPDQLLERATAQLAEVFGADGVSIMLADASGELSVRSSRGLPDAAKQDRKRIGEGISGKVAQTGKPMLLSGQVQGGSDPTASESMIAPLRAGGRTLGVVNVKHRSQQERYGQAHVDSLAQVASDIAAALLTAEEFQRAEEDRRQALVLYELSRFATLGTDPQSDLESAVAMLADNLRHDAVGVWAAEELHDGLAQELTGVVLALEGCQRALERDPSVLGPQLAKAARDARATLSDVRQYMAALRQTEESGGLNLPVAVSRLVDDLRRQSGLHVDLEETGAQRDLEPYVERALIRIVGEALRTVAQHGNARNAKVVLRYQEEQVVVTIEDDGKGFASNELDTAEERGHYGIVGMRERAEGVGGQLVVRSEGGRGPSVRASIPYRAASEEPTPAWADTVEDTEQRGAIEDIERTEKASFLGRLFGR